MYEISKLQYAPNYLKQTIKPDWVQRPGNIQIDTLNFCNLWIDQGCTGCIHCNVKPGGGWNLPRGRMPTEMIQYIIEYWGEKGSESVAPYINGEPMLDPRLPWICDTSEDNDLFVVIDTNGTVTEHRSNLVHRNLREVRFTLSATTPDVYQLVHGAPYYEKARENIEWFLEHRHPEQRPRLYFITNKHNMHQTEPYIEEWIGRAWITIFPLHEVPEIQTESTRTRPEAQDYWDRICREIVGYASEQPYRPIDIKRDGSRSIRDFYPWKACQGTDSFSVAWTGELLHCTDIPYRYNYGHIYERDMLEVWHQRNRAKLDHEACSRCNVKSPHHDEILRRYLDI